MHPGPGSTRLRHTLWARQGTRGPPSEKARGFHGGCWPQKHAASSRGPSGPAWGPSAQLIGVGDHTMHGRKKRGGSALQPLSLPQSKEHTRKQLGSRIKTSTGQVCAKQLQRWRGRGEGGQPLVGDCIVLRDGVEEQNAMNE